MSAAVKPLPLGKYEVFARLASGGAAHIFLARQSGVAGFNKWVCLKALLPDQVENAEHTAMFLDEARLAARLAHPACVQIYDLGRTRGVYYISMEYIFGETLWSLLRTVKQTRTALPVERVAAIVADACDGLDHAHELEDTDGRPFHLVHRDVSPQNIMISYEGQTKVLDFGIAKAETGREPTEAGVVKGKLSYMSPEQIAGGEVDRRSDIFSLGIVLFECLASRRLFRADSPEAIARLITKHRAPRLSELREDIPPALDEICARALEPRLGRRFQTAREMGDALRSYLDEVRDPQSASAHASLLRDRFGVRLEQRRRALAGAMEDRPGSIEALVDAFEAAPARTVDLFPEDVEQSPPPDFSERPPQSGFRVELESAVTGPTPIELSTPASMEVESPPDDDTQLLTSEMAEEAERASKLPAPTDMGSGSPFPVPVPVSLDGEGQVAAEPEPRGDSLTPLRVTRTPSVVVQPAPLTTPEGEGAGEAGRRFGLAELWVAALGGVCVGLVVGMVLTRWMFVSP